MPGQVRVPVFAWPGIIGWEEGKDLSVIRDLLKKTISRDLPETLSGEEGAYTTLPKVLDSEHGTAGTA
jgi:hypothetical protein